MASDQAQEKVEALSVENRGLRDEVAKLRQANRTLAAQLIERNETLVMLEQEARKARRRK